MVSMMLTCSLMIRVRSLFFCSGFSFAISQDSGNFPEVTERLHKSVIGLAGTFAPFLRKVTNRLSKPAVLDTLVFLKIVGVFGNNGKIHLE